MAANKFKPKASTNIVEGAIPVEEAEVVETPVEETEATNTPDEVDVIPTEEKTPVVEEDKTDENSQMEEENEPEVTITFDDKESTTPAQKNVKVCLKTKHSCAIGGVTYHFEKGKQYNVPVNVKSILMQADLLMPL